jgi:hypothetical protein
MHPIHHNKNMHPIHHNKYMHLIYEYARNGAATVRERCFLAS